MLPAPAAQGGTVGATPPGPTPRLLPLVPVWHGHVPVGYPGVGVFLCNRGNSGRSLQCRREGVQEYGREVGSKGGKGIVHEGGRGRVQEIWLTQLVAWWPARRCKPAGVIQSAASGGRAGGRGTRLVCLRMLDTKVRVQRALHTGCARARGRGRGRLGRERRDERKRKCVPQCARPGTTASSKCGRG